MMRLPGSALAPTRRLRAHRSRHGPQPCVGSDELLHLRYYTGQRDACSKGPQGPQDRRATRSRRSRSRSPACPLEEKTPEMHATLKAQGVALGAFAIIAVDNPMVAGTGHRICNDLHEGLHLLQEAGAGRYSAGPRRASFKDVLELPWAWRIYSLRHGAGTRSTSAGRCPSPIPGRKVP